MLFVMPLGQASGLAFPGAIPCGKSCHIFVNGNAEDAWFKRKKVKLIVTLFHISCNSNFLLCFVITISFQWSVRFTSYNVIVLLVLYLFIYLFYFSDQ